MCLMILGWRTHPSYPLVVAANRDEFHARPAAPLAPWADHPEMLAGRDLQAGGTWLGIDRRRRFGLVTNFRDLSRPRVAGPSRGDLIPGFLLGEMPAGSYLRTLAARAEEYAGFNLILADDDTLWYASNRAETFARELPPGIYGVSNHLLDTPWPKLERVRAAFGEWIAARTLPVEALFGLLDDRRPAPDANADIRLASSAGLSPEWARTLSSPFVLHPTYGTRASTVVARSIDGALFVRERRFDAAGHLTGESSHELAAGDWAAPRTLG